MTASSTIPESGEETVILRRLSAFHYALAALKAALAFMMFSYPVVTKVLSKGRNEVNEPWLYSFYFIFFAIGLVLAVLSVGIFAAAWYLGKGRNYNFVCLMAFIECFIFPLGTLLGVSTIVILSGKSVRGVFNSRSPVPPPVPGKESKSWEY